MPMLGGILPRAKFTCQAGVNQPVIMSPRRAANRAGGKLMETDGVTGCYVESDAVFREWQVCRDAHSTRLTSRAA